jgi:hypothetical protein
MPKNKYEVIIPPISLSEDKIKNKIRDLVLDEVMIGIEDGDFLDDVEEVVGECIKEYLRTPEMKKEIMRITMEHKKEILDDLKTLPLPKLASLL